MLLRIHRESEGERRVALVPRDVAHFTEAGHEVVLPAGAGLAAGFPDDAYRSAGATVASGDPSPADLLVGVGPLAATDIHGAAAVIALLDPLGNPSNIADIASLGTLAFAMELIPRTTLAQSMDALSSQATAAGYEAVLLAATALPRFFPMMMTAAGTIRPARVLVLGAGVAGLQAIATARRLGAVVFGYDIRPEAAEQVESLGAKFVGGPVSGEAQDAGGYAAEVDEDTSRRQQKALAAAVSEADVVITTAQVPGRKAPILIMTAMVDTMKPGAVLVDLAAATGGNCELTEPDTVVRRGGVAIHGPSDLASGAAGDASEMFSRNITALIDHLAPDGGLTPDFEDEITAAACVAADGAIRDERVAAALEGGR